MSDIITTVRTIEEGKYLVHSQQNCDAALKQTERLRQQYADSNKKSSMRLAAQVPFVTLFQWGQEDGVNYYGTLTQEVAAKLYKRLNSNEYNKLRVWDGKLGKEDFK